MKLIHCTEDLSSLLEWERFLQMEGAMQQVDERAAQYVDRRFIHITREERAQHDLARGHRHMHRRSGDRLPDDAADLSIILKDTQFRDNRHNHLITKRTLRGQREIDILPPGEQ